MIRQFSVRGDNLEPVFNHWPRRSPPLLLPARQHSDNCPDCRALFNEWKAAGINPAY